jgi:hypothetical protein
MQKSTAMEDNFAARPQEGNSAHRLEAIARYGEGAWREVSLSCDAH